MLLLKHTSPELSGLSQRQFTAGTVKSNEAAVLLSEHNATRGYPACRYAAAAAIRRKVICLTECDDVAGHKVFGCEDL